MFFSSIRYIQSEMSSCLNPKPPIFESKLDLYNYERMIFQPALDLSYVGSLIEIVTTMLDYMYNMSDEFERVYQPDPEYQTYYTVLLDQKDIHDMKQDIISSVRRTCREAIDYYKRFQTQFGYLWEDDKDLFLERFLKYGRALTLDEIQSLDTPECTVKEEKEITLKMFRKQIDYFYKVQEEVYQLEKSRLFNCWLRVNKKPFIAALSNVLGHWKIKFKYHLKNEVLSKLNVSLYLNTATQILFYLLQENFLDYFKDLQK